MRFFSKGLKNEFDSAVVNESSLFDPLRFYCISLGGNAIYYDYAVTISYNHTFLISSIIRWEFSLPKQFQRSRSDFKTDLDLCNYFGREKIIS